MPRYSTPCLVFFFKGSGAPRVLPSSPPRRSTNPGGRGRLRGAARPGMLHRQHRGEDVADPVRQLRVSGAIVVRGRGLARSEEHTSELQSRQYLVCRLLLEKKKLHNETSSYSLSTS